MHYALEEMKKSLSFISSKLVTKDTRGNLGMSFKLEIIENHFFCSLDGTDINQLQERLVSTEAQMCRILTALDSASNRVTGVSKSPPVKPPSEHSSSSDDEGVPNQIEDEEENEHRSLSISSSSQQSSDDDQSTPIITSKQKSE